MRGPETDLPIGFVRRIPGAAAPGIEMEAVLPNLDPRVPAAAGAEKAKENWVGEGDRAGEISCEGMGRTSIVQLGCTKLASRRRRTSDERWKRN